MYRRESIAYAEPLDTSFLLTIPTMQTSTDTSPPATDLLNPLAGWEAAARWNQVAFDWMAKGWQQWFALVTTLPPQVLVSSALPSVTSALASVSSALPSVTPAKAGAQEARAARSSDALDSRLRGNDGGVRGHDTGVSARATARAEPKRATRAKPKAKSKKTTTARTRS